MIDPIVTAARQQLLFLRQAERQWNAKEKNGASHLQAAIATAREKIVGWEQRGGMRHPAVQLLSNQADVLEAMLGLTEQQQSRQ